MVLKKRGLGRGLDALLGEASAQAVTNQLQHLPIEFLQRGKYQPRKDIDPEKLHDLANSIRAQGIVQPIVVRKIAHDRYEIIAGERRWRAAQMATLLEVPVVIRDIDDRAAIAIALIENIQREDLNPLDEAEALRRLLDEFEMTHQQIGEAIGKSRASISNLLRLLDLQPEIKLLLLNHDLEMGHARALLALQGAQQVAVGMRIAESHLTVRAAEKLIKSILDGSPLNPVKAVDVDTLRLQEQLTSKLGAKVKIAHKDNGQGSISIAYTSLDELDGIVAHFNLDKDSHLQASNVD
ncbi:MAG: ParB/RepB/Spo0J family partition protein [Methylococcales bacterium]|nr:ParB/RepB/Spo0J family partition protein [Methylococcales bacterium]